jgi:hypothetical protein
MADITKTYIDSAGLTRYDGKIKDWANSISQAGIKTVLKTDDGNTLKFYKKPSASLSDTADFSIDLGSSTAAGQIAELASKMGATWNPSTGHYEFTAFDASLSATTIIGAINEVISDFSTFIGEIPEGSEAKTITGYVIEAASEAENHANTYTDSAIVALNADLDASGTAQHGGTFVVSGVTEVDGVITAVDSVEVEAAGAAAALAATLATVATSGNAEDVTYDNTTSGLAATDVQAAIDEVYGGLGTAAAADVATSAITEQSTDDGLVSAAQVSAYVATEIAGLEGAMHFRGVITRQEGETDAEAIARVIPRPEAGDTVVMSDNAKEYIYTNVTAGWREVGDETEFVKKTTTIAGVDLQDNITKTELLTALNVEDGAEVNIIESVEVNGSALTPDANKAVNVTVAEGATDGTIAVNGTDVAVHGLGSAAYTASTAYDAAGTASGLINALDATSALLWNDTDPETHEATGGIVIRGGLVQQDGLINQSPAVTGGYSNLLLMPMSNAEIDALFA